MNELIIKKKIMGMCKRYKLKASYVNRDTIKVYSNKYRFETWLIKFEKNKISLYHNSNVRHCRYHLQNRFELYHWFGIVRYIRKHNRYVINRKHYRETDWVTDILRKHNQKVTCKFSA